MNNADAIKVLDEVIPHPESKMVDLAHLPIAVAWMTVREELKRYQAIGTVEELKKAIHRASAYGQKDEEHAPLEIHSLAELKRVIKPGAELMATYHSKHPETVGLIRVVTEVQTNGVYSKIKDQPDHKYSTYNYGRGFRTDYERASCYQFDGTTIRVLDARKGDGSVLFEFKVYEPRMGMEVQEETEETFAMTMGGM